MKTCYLMESGKAAEAVEATVGSGRIASQAALMTALVLGGLFVGRNIGKDETMSELQKNPVPLLQSMSIEQLRHLEGIMIVPQVQPEQKGEMLTTAE